MLRYKVGILSLYHKTWNYGAQLQAYALQRVIENMGFACEQIQFVWNDVETEIFYDYCSVDRERFTEFAAQIPHSTKVYTPDTLEACVNDYDIFVCGSDQIWGMGSSMPVYVLPLITLSFVPDSKTKIAYAASMGGVKVSPHVERILRLPVQRLDAVSVREKHAVAFTEKMSGKAVKAVLDPTLLLDREKWLGMAGKRLVNEPYVLLYCTEAREYLDGVAEVIADKLACRIVRLGYMNADLYGPEEFVSLIKYADYVVTDSFHGTVFSVIFRRQFFSFGKDSVQTPYSKNHRISDFLEMLGLQERMFLAGDAVETLLQKRAVEYETVEKQLLHLREESLHFLRTALVIKKDHESKLVGIEESSFSQTAAFLAKPLHEEAEQAGSCKAIFYALAKSFLEAGGIVAAASYDDNFKVHFRIFDTIQQLGGFCGNNHVQCDNDKQYEAIRVFLEEGRKVLFVGTPCQTAGIKGYLGKEYPGFYCIDLDCEGAVPADFWDKYLAYQKGKGTIQSISIQQGKSSKSMVIHFEDCEEVIPQEEDYFLNTCQSLYMEACYHCPFKGIISSSDLTLSEYCGGDEALSAAGCEKGTGLLLVQSPKGRELLVACKEDIRYKEIDRQKAIKGNAMLCSSIKKPVQYEYMLNLAKESSIEKLYYENQRIIDYMDKEALKRSFWLERKRNQLLENIRAFRNDEHVVEQIPGISSRVMIYGAGKLGKALLKCFADGPDCFIDRSESIRLCEGYEVLQPESEELKERVGSGDGWTVIVTPVWEYQSIKEMLLLNFPKINVVSLEGMITT